MRLVTEEGAAVGADEIELSLWWQSPSMTSGCVVDMGHHSSAEALEKAVMNKLDRLAEELRALGIEF